jgi:hypothetical protein
MHLDLAPTLGRRAAFRPLEHPNLEELADWGGGLKFEVKRRQRRAPLRFVTRPCVNQHGPRVLFPFLVGADRTLRRYRAPFRAAGWR